MSRINTLLTFPAPVDPDQCSDAEWAAYVAADERLIRRERAAQLRFNRRWQPAGSVL